MYLMPFDHGMDQTISSTKRIFDKYIVSTEIIWKKDNITVFHKE